MTINPLAKLNKKNEGGELFDIINNNILELKESVLKEAKEEVESITSDVNKTLEVANESIKKLDEFKEDINKRVSKKADFIHGHEEYETKEVIEKKLLKIKRDSEESYSKKGHEHSQYSLDGHTHDQYATKEELSKKSDKLHTHPEYATTEELKKIQLTPGPKGNDGEDGLSAFEIAVKNGFKGTEKERLLSLVGKPGEPGKEGKMVEVTTRHLKAHKHSTGDINGLEESVQDIIGNSLVEGTNITITYNDITGETTINSTGGGGGGAVDSVNGQTGVVVLDADDIDDTSTTHKFTTASEISKLAGIEVGAEVNNISDANAADLTDGGTTTLHNHDSRYYTETEVDTLLSGKANTSHTHIINDVTGLQTALDGKLATTLKGANNGLAELDGTGKVPASQLPSYVDDVIVVANFASLPGTGEIGKIYITEDTNITYRWNGSGYSEISSSLALGETSGTAYRGDRGKIAYDHSQLTSGNPHNVTKTDVGLSNVPNTDATQRSSHVGNELMITGTRSDFDLGFLGTSYYNTSDKVTNYERVRMLFDSNVFYIWGGNGGTGGSRDLVIGANANGADSLTNGTELRIVGGSGLQTTVRASPSSTYGWLHRTGAMTHSSGTYKHMRLEPDMRQTGTAGYDVLAINPTNTTTGSGSKNLINAQVGGVDKFKVDIDGIITSLHSTGGQLLNLTGGSSNTWMRVQAGVNQSDYGVATGTNAFFTGVAAGDAILRAEQGDLWIGTRAVGKNIHFHTNVGGGNNTYFDNNGKLRLINAETTGSITAGTTIELGNASDTTLSRSSAGVLAVEGVVVPTVSSTDTLTNKTIVLGSNTVSGTKAQFDTACTDGNFMYVGDAPTAHTHTLANVTDVTMTVANLNSLDDGVNSTLHFHDTDRARANHTGTQTASTISDFNEAAQDAVGTILTDSSTVDFTYNDGANTITASVVANSIPLNDLSDVVLTAPITGQVLKYNGTNWINDTDGGGGGGGSSTLSVTQSSHGFVTLDWLRYDEGTSTWVKAQSNTLNGLGMRHVVEVVDTNNFKVAKEGTHTISNALALGEYVLSKTTAGAYTQTIPSSVGDYVLYGMEVIDSTTVSFYPSVAKLIGSGLPSVGPDGFMTNGKIVTSVASNNLTVAIKTLAGNDPSPGDPVYCRIGGVIRTIDYPLSQTFNSGTNRFNAGSDELGTYEIDYFVYLGWTTVYNTVYLMPSRISHATNKGDFSTTNTNEKFAPNASDMNTNDPVDVIGRFNATLSGVGTYNRSIPATSRIINRPIHESRWLNFLGIFKGGGGGVAGTYGERDCKYKITPKSCECYIRLRADKNTLSGTIQVKLPFQENNAYNIAYISLGNLSSATKHHHGEIFNQNLQCQNLLSDNYYNRADFGSNVVLKGSFNYETV